MYNKVVIVVVEVEVVMVNTVEYMNTALDQISD